MPSFLTLLSNSAAVSVSFTPAHTNDRALRRKRPRYRYPQIDRSLARRLATGNWQRQKRLTDMQCEAECAKLWTKPRETAAEGQSKRKLSDVKMAKRATNMNPYAPLSGAGESTSWDPVMSHVASWLRRCQQTC
ncbi:hypothetical protein DM02DRAFT_635940 [Periconia macrospinosa]|uniref:Uncharacterized protein n=1 Tax=Periconia macrospinosa TaxID=97972 RepID=A0A2V1D0Y8_9PLEO|nr:hypothetical protein DM02DRAFT_635940 [Periconia macrospinosa]